MGDPELVARAQAAAERLERSWDRWRRMHGLAAEQAQPVSSYVGYSLAEPWGRARVVFGVGAEEAEQLSALLEQDTGTDSRFSQGLLWEQGAPETTDNGARPPVEPANGAQFGAGPDSATQFGAGPDNNTAQFAAAPVPTNGSQPVGGAGNGAPFAVGNGQGMVNGAQVPGHGTSGHVASGHGTSGHGTSGHGVSGHGVSGHGEEPPETSVPGARQGDQDADTDPAAEWAKNMPTFQPAPTADGVDMRNRGVPEAIRADLAGWTSGELPGQASAGLAAWPPADTSQTDGRQHAQAGAEPDGRENGSRRAGPPDPNAPGPVSPDPTAWLRLALLGPEPLGAVGSSHAER
jgi:hypothetical protein